MVNSTDESYDPHARMHESFPRADSGSYEVAGDITPLRPGQPAISEYAASKQEDNKRSMQDFANKGSSAVDTTNLTLFRKKQ